MDTSDPNNPNSPTNPPAGGPVGAVPPPPPPIDPISAVNTFTASTGAVFTSQPQTPAAMEPPAFSPTPAPAIPEPTSYPTFSQTPPPPTVAQPQPTPAADTSSIFSSSPTSVPTDATSTNQLAPLSPATDFNPFSSPTTSPTPQPAPEPADTTQTGWSDFSAQNLYAPSSATGASIPEPAATDLSNLIDPGATTAQPEATTVQPETLITPDGSETAPNLIPETPGIKMPKWVIGLAIGILIAVVGASAYFILGIGQSPQTSTSLPATQQPLQAPPTPRVTTPTPAPATSTPATSSGAPSSFGQLQATPSASPAASLPPAIKALQNRTK